VVGFQKVLRKVCIIIASIIGETLKFHKSADKKTKTKLRHCLIILQSNGDMVHVCYINIFPKLLRVYVYIENVGISETFLLISDVVYLDTSNY